mmetsp:Transcript_23006/g.30545  ORF Transcript_23006/g.30545 Transcript_23006/m.30545 type:complete len:303 (-) Transcript_23006:124-1032(-)
MRLSLLSLTVAVASTTTNAFVPTLLRSSSSSPAAAILATTPLLLSSKFVSTRATATTQNSPLQSAKDNIDTNITSEDENTTCAENNMSGATLANMVDKEYPGTAVARMIAVRARVAELASGDDLNGPWEDVRRRILWAGGLKDLPNSRPGQGYTGHSFNDYNHVDLTTMNDQVSNNTNNGQVEGIAYGNRLGEGIRIASLPELGAGGSWSTCAMGCNKDPPQDVAHLQFRSRIAFKLVWVPNELYDTFVLVDDDGKLLARGTPSDGPSALPPLRERQLNYRIMAGSKYSKEAEKIARNVATE